MSCDATIIGAGPAGLTAAYELSKAGLTSVVLEADERVGGLSRTVDYRGYRFDIGGHRFFSKVDYVNQIWQEILADDLLERPRLSRIYYRGHFFDYPLKAMNALGGLGSLETLRVILSYGKVKLFPKEPESNLEDWVSNRFGRRLYEIFFKTYTEKVWGITCTEISADWAAQRIKSLSLTEAVRSALLRDSKNRDGEIITTLIDRFLYPRQGPGMMWERCEAIVGSNGSPTARGTRIERLFHRAGQVSHIQARTSDGSTADYEGTHFISSMPLRELIFALYPEPPEEVRRAAADLKYRDYLTVVLVVDRPDVFPDNWIYVHDAGVKMGRIQNYRNWSPEMVPDATTTSLGLEYFLWESDEEWSWSDDRLIELGIRECAALGLIEPSEVRDATVVRMKKAYPVYDGSYRKAVDLLKAYLSEFNNLQTIGRNGLHRYNNQDHSMMTGVLAARNIMGEANDVWRVNTEKEYHEERRDIAAGDRLVPERIRKAVPTETSAAIEAETEREIEVEIDREIESLLFPKLDRVALGSAIGLTAGLIVFLATAVLLVKGGPDPGENLSLLGQYLPGYAVTWAGALIGLAEAGVAFFVLGFTVAWLRNSVLMTYLEMIRRREERARNEDLLERL